MKSWILQADRRELFAFPKPPEPRSPKRSRTLGIGFANDDCFWLKPSFGKPGLNGGLVPNSVTDLGEQQPRCRRSGEVNERPKLGIRKEAMNGRFWVFKPPKDRSFRS
uniref:hypothetical protein n=1 Tax=uncultured Sphingomonas sp. TaxID=158754 RepID=UPI0035C95EAE